MYIKLTQLIHGESEALQGFKSFVHSGKRLGINNTLVRLTFFLSPEANNGGPFSASRIV